MSIINNKELYIQINSYKRIKASEAIFLLAFTIYLINQILYTTMFYPYMKNGITTLINVVVLSLIVSKIILFDKYSIKKIILIVTLFVVFNVAYIKNRYNNLFYLSMFIVGAKDIDFNKICKVYFFTGLLIVILAMIAVKLNIIEHIIYYRNGKANYSFGSVYTTDFGARIFFLCTAYCYLRGEKLNIIDSIVFIIIGVFIIKFCGAKLDSTCIVILSILPLLRIKTDNINSIGIIKKYFLSLIIPISAVLSITITNMYSLNNSFTVLLNQVFTGRLGQGKYGIEEYGFSLFGQQIDMVGNGGVNGGVNNYFYIDSSYLNIALRYGSIILFLICIYYLFFIKARLEKGDILLSILIIIIGINSIVAHHFIDIAYNPFILVFFSNIQKIKSEQIKIKYKF